MKPNLIAAALVGENLYEKIKKNIEMDRDNPICTDSHVNRSCDGKAKFKI
jgi:hypothetical protein